MPRTVRVSRPRCRSLAGRGGGVARHLRPAPRPDLHGLVDGVSGSDGTGVVAALAGLALVGLGVVVPVTARKPATRSRGRRWVNRGIATVAALVLVPTVVVPVAVAIGQTHKIREPIGPPPGDQYLTVAFEASDGLRLAGWYAPSNNGAAVLLVHSAGGDRTGSVEHARMLSEHGYGVLLSTPAAPGTARGAPTGTAGPGTGMYGAR